MTRRTTATIRTTHDDPQLVASAVTPDETDEMETTLEDDAVVTRITRETTGGLHATVDDYVVNLDVATAVAAHANRLETNRSQTNRSQTNRSQTNQSEADAFDASAADDPGASDASATNDADAADASVTPEPDSDAGHASDRDHDNT